MKNALKYILHRVLGFRNYLFLFSLYKIRTLRGDKREGDFFSFAKLIPANTAVLDIGANIGIMTVHLARMKKGISVFAFEPMPANIEAFKRVVSYFKLDNVRLLPIALGDHEGEAEMVMPVVSSVKMQGLSHVVHDSITEFNEGIRFTVPLRRLDNIEELKSTGKKISGIKIDIENFEYFALKGGEQLLKTHRPVVYAELWENQNRESCFELLRGLGYSIRVSDGRGGLCDFDPAVHKKQNFIFTPLN